VASTCQALSSEKSSSYSHGIWVVVVVEDEEWVVVVVESVEQVEEQVEV